MLYKKDLKHTSDLIESFRPKITYFEQDILVPGVLDRLGYISQIFNDFKNLCEKPDVALHIDAALRKLVDPGVFKLGVPEPQVGTGYLSAIANQCQEQFIAQVNQILNKHPKVETVKTIEATTNFLNDASNFCQTIAGCKDKLFLYSLRSFLSVKKLGTGEVILGPPVELSLILMPFQTRLEELITVAQTTIQSIEGWAKQISEQKTKQIDLIAHLAQLKTTQWNFWSQMAVIAVTVAFVLGSQRINLYLEKRDLENVVFRLNEDLRVKNGTIDGLKKKIDELERLNARPKAKFDESKTK